MAIAINISHVRGTTFKVNPFDVVIKEDARNRFDAPGEEDIIRLALSMLEIGQLQPVECRRAADQQPVLTLGFTRAAAARLIRQGFTHEGQSYQKEDFPLEIRVIDCNPEEAFIRNITENDIRNPLSAIDNIHNWRKLRDTYGKTDSQIARIYNVSPSTISRQMKLLILPREVQMQVHVGNISVAAALQLVENVAESDYTAVVGELADADGKVSAEDVKTYARKHQTAEREQTGDVLNDEGRDTTPSASSKPAKPIGRSIKDVRGLFDAMSIMGDDRMSAIGAALSDFCRGVMDEQAVYKAVGKALDGKTGRRAA